MITQRELENLRRIFEGARDNLLKTIINDKSVGLKTYYNTIYKQLQKEIELLEEVTGQFIIEALPKEYEAGLKEVYDYFTRNNLKMRQPNMFARIHTQAVGELAREMQYNIQQGLAQVGRQILRYADNARDNALRQAGLLSSGQKIASGQTIVDMKNNMVKQLTKNGFMTVQYGSGSKAYQVALDSYAMLCARSTTREASNMARENQLIANGYDLVKMTTNYPTCKICAKYEGRVYSLTGKDKRFPVLMETAFKSGYHNIHPNCRHSVVPYIEELREPKEVEKDLKIAKEPFEEKQSDSEIGAYNKTQKLKRQTRRDLEQYRTYKAVLKSDAPNTFEAFRKMKNASKEEWAELKAKFKQKIPSS